VFGRRWYGEGPAAGRGLGGVGLTGQAISVVIAERSDDAAQLRGYPKTGVKDPGLYTVVGDQKSVNLGQPAKSLI